MHCAILWTEEGKVVGYWGFLNDTGTLVAESFGIVHLG